MTPQDAIDFSAKPKMGVRLLVDLQTKEDLSLAYTPGIAEVCKLIQTDESALTTHTFVRNNLAVISDGTAVLGLGNIGHKASYPVMEGKSMLFARFAGIDAVPIIVHAASDDELIQTIVNISDSFGAINLEDIAAPRCFVIERALKERLSIPVMHDDQQGTAVVVLAALSGALTLLPHLSKESRVVVSGAGAAGMAIVRLLVVSGYTNIVVTDSKGIISRSRTDLRDEKLEIVQVTNREGMQGELADALNGAGIFVGVSRGGLVTKEMVSTMAPDSVVIAMANPVPEILPDEARVAGAAIVATGRSDYPNQVNNALGFPGIFRAAIDLRQQITQEMLLAASAAIVEYHQGSLAIDNLMPSILDEGIHRHIALRVKEVLQ